MKFRISEENYWELRYAIGESLSVALKDPSQYEPQLVANMVWHIPQQINGFTLHKKGLTIQTGGVFVHRHPFVKCADFPDEESQSVEIGDLLFLRTEKQNGKVTSRSAFLLQAKKFRRLPVKPNDKNQQHLYAKWPPFEYVNSTNALNGKNRHITGPDLYVAAKYLLIGKDPRCCLDRSFCHFYYSKKHHHCVLTAQPSYPEISQYRCFVEELTDFILGDAGKPYQWPAPQSTWNWDRVIEDLTDVTGKTASKYITSASSGKSLSRGQCLSFLAGNCMVSGSILLSMGLPGQTEDNSDGPPKVPPRDSSDDSSDGGISVIEFIVSTDESSKEA